MKLSCPHCGKPIDMSVLAAKIGAVSSPRKTQAARLNGKLGGRPKVKHPVRLRPYHPGHPDHPKWLAEQAKKKTSQ